MPAPTSRPVHPCVMSIFDGNRGAEYSTWAFITTRPPQCPNLVTAQASTLRVYTMEEESGRLCCSFEFVDLAGNVCYLERLPSDVDASTRTSAPDALLLGFCGHPRLSVVSVSPQSNSSPSPALLSSSSLLDLTQALTDAAYGSLTPLDHDLIAATVAWKRNDGATVSVILGGGIAVACIDIQRCKKLGGWLASEPYMLPLQMLHPSLKRPQSAKLQSILGGAGGTGGTAASSAANASNVASIATGFGDIISAAWGKKYTEPTVVLLHSSPASHGRVWPGRLGRPHWQPATRFGLLVTAISVTVAHQRSAVLWSVEVPADAISVYSVGERGFLIVCTNSLLFVNNAGRVDDFVAVNGYARSTCPHSLLDLLKPNPKPFPKLAMQLDGATLAFGSDRTAFVLSRGGVLFLLNIPVSPADTVQQGSGTPRQMSLLPLGSTLGTCGNVASLIAWPLANASSSLYDKFVGAKNDKMKESLLSVGLLFAGSRLGDSSLLGYALELKPLPWQEDSSRAGKKVKTQNLAFTSGETALILDPFPSDVLPEVEDVLRMEEEALYAPTTNSSSKEALDIVPLSSDEESEAQEQSPKMTAALSVTGKRQLDCATRVAVLRALTALDTLTGLGPLGLSCEGPITSATSGQELDVTLNPNAAAISGVTALITPCGYGSSGGIGIISAPVDERSILFEKDMLNVQSLFSLKRHGLILMGSLHNGIRVLRLQNTAPEKTISEDYGDVDDEEEAEEEPGPVNLIEAKPEECLDAESVGKEGISARTLFDRATILSCADFFDGSFVIGFSYPSCNDDETSGQIYGMAVAKEDSGTIKLLSTFLLPPRSDGADLLSMTSLMRRESSSSSKVCACTWSTGSASLVLFDKTGILTVRNMEGGDKDVEPMDSDNEDAVNTYYRSRRIVAVDLFRAPSNLFQASTSTSSRDSGEDNDGCTVPRKNSLSTKATNAALVNDSDLYFVPHQQSTVDEEDSGCTRKAATGIKENRNEDILFLGVCRQSGELEIFSTEAMLCDRFPNEDAPIWSADGCSYGSTCLSSENSRCMRLPRQHEVCVDEMRFFFCGPSIAKDAMMNESGLFRPLCLAVETSAGDLFVYESDAKLSSISPIQLTRVPLKNVSRESHEQTRLNAKLRRKGIVATDAPNEGGSRVVFRHNKLHRFHSISGQDGLFAAVDRPLWLVAERGKPTALVHRSRHAAPAGGKYCPISGFCSGVGGVGAFLTAHQRLGRVGTQRLTLYRGISTLFENEGVLPGGGLCVEKIPLGVTVRRIQFIDDASLCSAGRCLYAMLVSRELEEDTSHLNDDGMTLEERERIEQEKEAAKIKRQVEADLGGFDVEQEWVEEIEREDCFQINLELGGCPPIVRRAHSLWIVDASEKWMALDSYELGEYEHGLTMSVMALTEFPEEPGTSNASEASSDDLKKRLFIAVGVGIVEKNGEDVSSKGKVLLFNIESRDEAGVESQGVELALAFEKDVFHGPVSSLTCFSSEGKNRLVIGAGADINVEQWGQGRLLQVGFFRATMQILDIFMFKNFLLLSDAYDSLYFLVWRESDKSLTLLSKDYDPLVVYAAGTMSRGGSLSFVCQDDRQNLQFFQYAPSEAAARGGNKLVCRADFHLGAQTSAFRNHSCRSSLWVNSASPSSTLAALQQQDPFFGRSDDDQRLGVNFGTSDGGLGAIVPLSEPVYWRLAALQSVMANALESDCALSQRSWRLYRRSFRRGGCRNADRKKSVIDGAACLRYVDLPLYTQEDLASSIGSTVGLILDNLLELVCAAAVI